MQNLIMIAWQKQVRGLTMKGIVKSYLPTKGYGYITGDDNKSYFFRAKSVRTDPRIIADNLPVHFEERATQQGYEAINVFCEVGQDNAPLYDLPSRFHIYRDGFVKDGLEILEESSWEICASTTMSGESPEDAKDEMIARAKILGANSIIHSRYNKGTGMEGTYRFRTHHFVGVPVVVAIKRFNGQFTREQLAPIIDKQAERYKARCAKKNKISLAIRLAIYTIVLVATFAVITMLGQKLIGKVVDIPALCVLFGVIFVDLVVLIWWLPNIRHGWWLQKR
jgi:cold shock CspA family protein/uncharacterized protein YbjQ (UPF0145 family)